MRRIITVVVVALVMGAMMLAMAMPAFAQSENSCGKSNPAFPAKTGQGLENCGVSNNANFPDKPEGQPFQD